MKTDAGSLLRFSAKCYVMPATIAGIGTAGIAASALITKKTVQAAAQARGWPTAPHGKRKLYVRVKYDVTPVGALVGAYGGGSYLFEFGSYHQPEGWGEPKARKGRSGGVINIPGIGVFSSIHHPGLKGRGFWTEGITAARPLISDEFGKGLETGLRKVFR